MRHRKSGRKLNINSSHKKAMFRNMVTSLFKYDRIRTTDTKAKELRSLADHLVTLAKRGDLHARRQVLSIVREKAVVHKLFEEANNRFGKVSGGYTRILKIGRRPGDAALMSFIELVDASDMKKKEKKKTAPKTAEVAAKTEAVDTAQATPASDAVEAQGAPDADALEKGSDETTPQQEGAAGEDTPEK